MEELLVEGLTPEDFKLLRDIIKTYKASMCDSIPFIEIVNLYSKINEIVDCLEE